MHHISHVILSCYIFPGTEGLGEGYIEKMSRLKIMPIVSCFKRRITVNYLYSGHYRNLELVSSLARVRNSGSLFQSKLDIYERG